MVELDLFERDEELLLLFAQLVDHQLSLWPRTPATILREKWPDDQRCTGKSEDYCSGDRDGFHGHSEGCRLGRDWTAGGGSDRARVLSV